MPPEPLAVGFSVLPSMTDGDILDGMEGLLLQIRMGMMTLESWTVGERAGLALARQVPIMDGRTREQTDEWLLQGLRAGGCIYNGVPVHFVPDNVQVTAIAA